MLKNEIFSNIINKKRGDKYDVAVMYSGGKDSSYLLCLLKEVYNLRVVAVTVDNGYEHDGVNENIKKFTDGLGVELVIINPGKDNFTKMFRTLIMENEYFKREKVNHVCFICNNVLWCSVAKYAADMGIPYVASGLSLTQLNSGRSYPLVPDRMANAIAEKSTKQILKNAMEGFYQCNAYKDLEFKDFIDGLNGAVKNVTTVYPYIYHQVSVEDLKTAIIHRGWRPPIEQSLEGYISSGCKVMSSVIRELEKIGMITLNEREQAKAMVQAGLINESDMEYANHDASKEIVSLKDPLFDELDIKDYLVKFCEDNNREYIS